MYNKCSGNSGLKFWTNNRLKQLARLLVLALSLNILADLTVLSNSLLAVVPVSIDQTSLTRLAVLQAMANQTGANSFNAVLPYQVATLSAVTTALTTAITLNPAIKPNPPLNSFVPALLNDQNCSNPGDCALSYIPLALVLYKLNNYPSATAAQYSSLIASLFYTGANANFANNQLLKSQATQKIALLLSGLTPPILANFFVPNSNSTTYAGLALDQDSGILIKTPSGTPAGTASQFCTDLVTANLLDFQVTPTMPLTVNNIWLGAICTDSTQCCGNNICNTTSANLGNTPGGKPYGYCGLPACAQVPCSAGYICDLTLKQCVASCVPLGDQANSVQDCCPSADQASGPTVFIDGNTCASCVENSNSCVIFSDGTNSCCSGFCDISTGVCIADCNPGQSCCTATGNDPITNQPLCPAGIVSCCSSDYSCALINGDTTGEAGNKCCIAGATSPGNQALPCITNSTDGGDGSRGDSNCCTGAMCIVDSTDPNKNGYCVSCIANPSSYYTSLGVTPPVCTTDSSGVQCCDDQQLNCVPVKPATGASVNNCVSCIGQSCASVSCCSTTVVPGITCDTINDGTNTPKTCCIGSNSACTADQQCCTGNNCFNNICTTCGSQGAACSNTILCCTGSTSIETELYCDVSSGATTGTCQLLLGAACTAENNICSSSDKLYCDILAGAAAGTCQLCLGSVCSTTGGACVSGCNDSKSNFCATTGIGLNSKSSCTACLGSACTGTTCAANCDSSTYTCSNNKCVLSTPAPIPDDGFTWSSTDTIIASIVGGGFTLGFVFYWLWRRSRSGNNSTRMTSRASQRTGTVRILENGADATTLSDTIGSVDPKGYQVAINAFRVDPKTRLLPVTSEGILANYKPSSAKIEIGTVIQQFQSTKIAAIGAGPITDPTTISLLKIYSDLDLLKVSGARYGDITFGKGASAIVIKLSEVRKSKIDAVINAPAANPNSKSPLIAAAMSSYIDEIVSKFTGKSGGYVTLDELLGNPTNLEVMREYWTAKYAQMVANDASGEYKNGISGDQMFTEMLKDPNFKLLFANSESAQANLISGSVADASTGGYFITKFKGVKSTLPDDFNVAAYATRYKALLNSSPQLAKFASNLIGDVDALDVSANVNDQANAMYAYEQAASELPVPSGSWNSNPDIFFEPA